MRSIHMVGYHWRRRWKLLILFGLLMLVVATATLLYVRAEYADTMVVFSGGVAHVERGYSSMNMSFDYSFLFIVLVVVMAAGLLRQERSFFVTASAARWEFVLGAMGFIFAFSLAATGVNWLVGVLNRLELPLLGMNVRQGLSARLLLTAGNPTFFTDLVLTFTRMLAAAGWASLIYALFARWWKPLLILAGAGIVVMIVLGLQVRLGAYTQGMVNTARSVVEWIEEYFIPVVVPKIERFYSEKRLWALAARDVAQFLAGYALVYPIIRRMRVK